MKQHVTFATLRFGYYGPIRKVKDKTGRIVLEYAKRPEIFALIPPDHLAQQLKYKGLWKETKEQIETYFDFLRSDPGYLIWPINDKAGHGGQRLEDIYDKDPGYLEWVVNTYKGEVLIPLVVDYMKYREACSGGFRVPEISDFKDEGFSPVEKMLGQKVYYTFGPEKNVMVEDFFTGETKVYLHRPLIPVVVKQSKPGGWYVSNPDKTGQEMIDSSKGEFFYTDPFGKSCKELLWIPPRSFTQYRSDLFFVSHYKDTKEEKYVSRTHPRKEDRLALYIRLLEDIDLMGDGVEDVGMLITRLNICMKGIFSLWEYEMSNTTFPPTPTLGAFCIVRNNFTDLKRMVEEKFTEVCDRLLGLHNTITYYEDNDEHNDILEEQEEMELSPQDEQAVRDGEEEDLEALIQETEDPPQEYVEEGSEIYYETEEEMDFLGEYREGNYVMYGERRWL